MMLLLNDLQLTDFDTFYLTTCKDGTEAVTWVHPRLGTSVTASETLYWVEKPSYSYFSLF